MKNNGKIDWNEPLKSIDQALSSMEFATDPPTLKQRVELVNAYVLSKITHYLRIEKIPNSTLKTLYNSVFKYLGKKKTRVGQDRVLTPTNCGGFGLWDLADMNRRLLAAWKLKWANQPPNSFHDIVNFWNDATLANGNL